MIKILTKSVEELVKVQESAFARNFNWRFGKAKVSTHSGPVIVLDGDLMLWDDEDGFDEIDAKELTPEQFLQSDILAEDEVNAQDFLKEKLDKLLRSTMSVIDHKNITQMMDICYLRGHGKAFLDASVCSILIKHLPLSIEQIEEGVERAKDDLEKYCKETGIPLESIERSFNLIKEKIE